MPKQSIPNPLERRHLIERTATAEQSLALADAYLAADRPWEAIAFLAKADASDRLAAIRDAAVEAGDAFLVREVTRVLRDDVPAARWRQVASAAAAAGKERYAAQAERLAERAEGRK
jgi:hypothetical protein